MPSGHKVCACMRIKAAASAKRYGSNQRGPPPRGIQPNRHIKAPTHQVIPREPGRRPTSPTHALGHQRRGKKYGMRDAPQREEGAARHRRPHHRGKTRTKLAREHKNSTRYAHTRPSASNARYGKGTRATNPRVPSSPEVWPCTHVQAAAGTRTGRKSHCHVLLGGPDPG